MYELIRHIKKAEILSQELIQLRLDEIERQSKGFNGFFKSLFGLIENYNDEFTLEERKKVPVYLNSSMQQLCNMFEITTVSIRKYLLNCIKLQTFHYRLQKMSIIKITYSRIIL